MLAKLKNKVYTSFIPIVRRGFRSTNFQQVDHVFVFQQLKYLNLSEGGDRELNGGAKNTKSSVTRKRARKLLHLANHSFTTTLGIIPLLSRCP